MKNFSFRGCIVVLACLAVSLSAAAGGGDKPFPHQSKGPGCRNQIAGRIHVDCFCRRLGKARHLAVNGNGDVYVKLDKLINGSGIMRLRDNNGDGQAEDTKGFGDFKGTGIAIKNGYLYASSDEEVFRYKLDAANNIADPAHPEKLLRDCCNVVNTKQRRLHWTMMAISM